MKNRVLAGVCGVLAAWPLRGGTAQTPILTPRDSALHALNRLAYGPRPGEVDRVAAAGVMQWIDRQLSPSKIDDHALAERERAFDILDYDRGDLAKLYLDAERERRERKRAAGADSAEGVPRGSSPPNPGRRRPGPLSAPPPMSGRPPLFDPGRDPMRADSLRRQAAERMPKGINENYARELLELHTLGVDGGYTQQDVIDVARIFTGWSVRRPQQGGDFEFHDWAHDYGEKVVLGVRFPAGHGMDEGVRLLQLLANHPATMHHVSRQLCQRFVNDDPPDGCVDDAVTAWKQSDGDIRAVLRAIVRSPDFWAPENVRAKIKTPLEFVVSAARAVGGEPDTTPRLAQVVARLGEPLYLHVAPDGYPAREDAWVNSGARPDRMNAAVALATGRLPGVTVSLDSIVPATPDAERLIAQANAAVLGGTMSEHTKAVIRRQLSDASDPAQARALAVGLAIGGPEFQRQ